MTGPGQGAEAGADRDDHGERARSTCPLVGYLVAILVMSAVGSFGGASLIGAPWDSLIVAAIGLAAFIQGVRSAQRHLALHPAPAPRRIPAGAESPA